MTRRLTVQVDPAAVSMAAAIRTAAQASPLLVITSRVLSHLAAELGGHEAAARYLFGLAESIGKPVAVNVDTGAETSSTAFIAPRSWTEERLAGWVAGRHEDIEAAFGPAIPIGPNRAERRRRQREGPR